MSETDTTDTAPVDTPSAEDTLGTGGVEALRREREARVEAERLLKESAADGSRALAESKARRAAEKRAADLEARVKEFEDASKSEAEKAAARAEAAEKALAEVTAKAARLQVAAEVGVPADLVEFLTGGDEESLRAQAEKLMAATAASKAPRVPQPDPSQGAKPGGSASQLTRADLAGMSPEAITTAKAEGRLNDLLGIKS